MAAAYSMDLRARVLKDADAGFSSKELAEWYRVGRRAQTAAARDGIGRNFVRHCGYRVTTAL